MSYSTGLVSRRSVVDEQELESTLNSQLDLVTYGYSLYIDDTPALSVFEFRSKARR